MEGLKTEPPSYGAMPRKNTIQPAQRVLTYTFTPSSGAAAVDIDLAKDLSAVNRRLYRQGMQYYVSHISLARGDTGISAMSVKTAGDTWIVHNAWKKAFKFWQAQQKEVSDVMPSVHGKWADFKVQLDDNAQTAIDTIAGDGGTIVPDEWNYSNYVWDDDGTERTPTFCIIGATAATSKIGMVQEYAISRARVQAEPALDGDASDSIYGKGLVNDEAMTDLIELVESENDVAPYDVDNYVGGDTTGDAPFTQDFVVANFQAGRAMTTGFTAECGLMRVEVASLNADASAPSDVAHIIQVHLAPGPYKGVMASPMGQ